MTTKTLEDDFEIKMFPLELYMGRLSLIMLRHSLDVVFHTEPKDHSLSIKIGGYTGRIFYIHKGAEDIRGMEKLNPLGLAESDAEIILQRLSREIN